MLSPFPFLMLLPTSQARSRRVLMLGSENILPSEDFHFSFNSFEDSLFRSLSGGVDSRDSRLGGFSLHFGSVDILKSRGGKV